MIQGAQDTIGINRSSTVVSSSDSNTRTLLALAQTEGRELLERFSWPETQEIATHITLAAELQGAMSTIAPGFGYILNQTFWNRTLTQPVRGPLSPSEWQLLKARVTTGPYAQYRIRGGNLYAYPATSAGDTWVFEYQTTYFCEDSGGTKQSAWAADDDTGLLDENLMEMGVVWRFKEKNSLGTWEYDRQKYEQKLANETARTGGKKVLNMQSGFGYRSGIYIPEGSWT